jgi:predicted nucleic acid-binding protein
MFLIDTSVWINVLRDKTGVARQNLQTLIKDENFFTTSAKSLDSFIKESNDLMCFITFYNFNF